MRKNERRVLDAPAPDAHKLHILQERTRTRKGIVCCGKGFTVALAADGTVRYTGDNRWGQGEASLWTAMQGGFCGETYILGLCRDGTVKSAGYAEAGQLSVASWASISLLSCSSTHAAALTGNGRVLCTGDERAPWACTSDWTDIVDVACGKGFTLGLKRNGTVAVACDRAHASVARAARRWQGIVGLFADVGGRYACAIDADGRVHLSVSAPRELREWRRVAYLAASGDRAAAVTSDGRLLTYHITLPSDDSKTTATPAPRYVACAMGVGHGAALSAKGRVAAWGENHFEECETGRWKALFADYEEYSAARIEEQHQARVAERQYQKRRTRAERYARRLSCGERLTACVTAEGRVHTSVKFPETDAWGGIVSISCGVTHVLALRDDGSVVAAGNNVGGCCAVDTWQNIKAIVAKKYHSLGLTEDGRVLFAGWNTSGQGDVEEWGRIRLLRAADGYTVGVDQDGQIWAAGKSLPFDPSALGGEWRDLIDLQLSDHHMVGLRRDGRVVAVGDDTYMKNASDGRGGLCSQSWRDVREIAVGDGYTVGLCYGGRVLAEGACDLGQCRVDEWRRVVSVRCGKTHTVGLCADGTVLSAGQYKTGVDTSPELDYTTDVRASRNGYAPCKTDEWRDVLAVACGDDHVVALDVHGRLRGCGLDADGQCSSAVFMVVFRNVGQMDGSGSSGGGGGVYAGVPHNI